MTQSVRFALRSAFLLLISLALAAWMGMDCAGFPQLGLPGTSQNGQTADFPKTAVWTRRTINGDAAVRPVAVRTADFDGDDLLDVAVGYAGLDDVRPGVFIHFQTDVDNFTPVLVVQDAALDGLSSIAVADLNADDLLDIVAATAARLYLMFSPADPRQSADWTTFTVENSEGDGIGPWMEVALGDIDGAAGQDLVACGQTSGRLSWFASPSANPTSGAGWIRVDIDAATRAGAEAVALLDVDENDRMDVISTASDESAARVAGYSNPADPLVDPWNKLAIGNLPNAARVHVADLNLDGREDVVATNPVGRQIGWYLRPADPAAAWSGYLITQYTAATPVDIGIVDVDGNGQPDLIAATRQPGSLRWFTPTGPVTDVWTENNLRDLTEDVARLATGDFDGDGRIDVAATLLAADSMQDSVAWFENPEP